MKLKRLISLVLTVLMLMGISTVCLTVDAAEVEIAETGEKLGNYYNVDYLEDMAYDGGDLGCTYTPSKTTWKVWSPNATKIQLKRYSTGSDMESGAMNLGKHDMTYDKSTGVWSVALTGDHVNEYYTYVITSPAGTNETYDIYAEAAGVNGNRSMVVDLDTTDPDGWDKDEHVFQEQQTDEAIWEVHIADLTSNDNSGVDENYQGLYLGFAEGGLTLNGKSVGIDYLVENGIKAVHIQCPFDFASGDETNPLSYNWGYDPKNYNVPEGMYSTNPYDGNVRIKEFKQLVQALHDRDITVIMGVVFNHTYVTEQSAFTYTVPGYYYRMSSATYYINGTGCGNTLASDKAMFRSYMKDSLKYWVEEYHIDGFRFDLMAAHDIVTMNEIRAMFNSMYNGEGKKIIMYGEPWGVGSVGLKSGYDVSTVNMAKLSANVAGFNSYTRMAMHGSESGTIKGWFQGATTAANATALKRAALGKYSSDGQVAYPNQSVNYVDCHDGVTWWDNIVMANKAASTTNLKGFDTTEAKYRQQLRTSFTFLFTAQGVPFTLAGTEFARTKYGNGNSYDDRDDNAFDWTRISTYAQEVEYAKGMRQIRAAFSAFRTSMTYNNLTWLQTSNANGILAYSLNNSKSGEWTKAIVIASASSSAGTVTLPSGTWTVVANGEKAGLASLGTASGTYNVPAFGSAVLVQGTTNAKDAEFETITINHYADDVLIKTSEVKYEVGTTWRATPDTYTIFDHNITKVEANTGTKDGDTVYGTVTKGQNVVVNFYYERFNTSDYLTVKYVDEKGTSIAADVTYRVLDNEEYNIPFENVSGFELVSDKYPTNFKGVFDAEDPAVVTFVYKKLDTDSITVYYYDALGSNTSTKVLRMYAYTDEEEKPLGEWNDKNQNMTKVTDASELPEGETVGNWYKYVIDENSILLYEEDGVTKKSYSSLNVMFLLSDNSKQEPLNGEAGYKASDIIYVKDRIVTFNADIIVSHIDANTGAKLADDQRIEFDNVTNNEIYTTAPKKNLGKAITPNNASGALAAGSTCVVYMYEKSDDPNPTDGLIYGDADMDEDVNVKDATVIQKHVAYLLTLIGDGARCADVDLDENITIKDATAIQKYAASIEIDEPVGEFIPGTGTDTPVVDEKAEWVEKADALVKDANALLEEYSAYERDEALAAGSTELQAKADFGFDISKEDTASNEYQKLSAANAELKYNIVYGELDEIKASYDKLDKEMKWFEHFVTEIRKEPVADVDPWTIDVSNGQYPLIEGYNTIVYSAKSNWSSAYIYAWNDASGKNNGEWPGLQMKFALTNDYGENQFVGYVPVEFDRYIISNGTGGGANQTEDLVVEGSMGMYMKDTTGTNGTWTIGTWSPNFYTP